MIPSPEAGALLLPDDLHMLLSGASGRGKTGALLLIALAKLKNAAIGTQVIDPDGELSPRLLEHLANLENRLSWRRRRVHHLKPASKTHTFGIPLLAPRSRDPLACHEA